MNQTSHLHGHETARKKWEKYATENGKNEK